jgi:hypothetical protein
MKNQIPLALEQNKYLNKFEHIIGYKTMWESIIDVFEPQICFTVCYYHDLAMALYLACASRNVQSVELQHGVILPCDPFWNYRDIPTDGYAALPNVIWTWGQPTAEFINRWATKSLSRHQAICGGNLTLATSELYGQIQFKDTKKLNNHEKTTILFTQQPFTWKNYFDTFPSSLIEAISNGPSDWNWIIRLHPTMPLESKNEIQRYFSNFSKNVSVHCAQERELFKVMSQCDYHISIYSSCHYEAEFLNLPPIIIGNEMIRGYFDKEINEGIFLWAESGSKLIDIIQSKKQCKKRDKPYIEVDLIKIEETFNRLLTKDVL